MPSYSIAVLLPSACGVCHPNIVTDDLLRVIGVNVQRNLEFLSDLLVRFWDRYA